MYDSITMIFKDAEVQVEHFIWKNFGFVSNMVDDLVDMNTSDGIKVDLSKYNKVCMENIVEFYDLGTVEEDDKILEEFFDDIDDDTLFQMIILCDFLEDKNLLKLLCYHVRDKLCGKDSEAYFEKVTSYEFV